MAQAVFWISFVLILYHHVIYPLLLPIVAKWRTRDSSDRRIAPDSADLPSITLVIPCHNEAKVIAAKIANLAALEYPRDRLSVVLALDGCTDATQSIAAATLETVPELKCRLAVYDTNIGKVAVLNDQISRATADVVALSDASSLLAPDALLRAAAHFIDPETGVVCPAYQVIDASNPGEQAYWAYQSRVRVYEARVAAPMGAHGAFYLFRRPLAAELEPDTINDDFVLPMRIVAAGHRAIYDPAIVATELEPSSVSQEFRRRVRIGAGNFQQLIRLPGLANPHRPWLAFVFCSGKGLRALMPFLLLSCLMSSLVLASGSRFYAAVVAFEVAALVLVVLSAVAPQTQRLAPVKIANYFLTGHLASGIGAVLLVLGQGSKTWRFSKRQSAPA